MSSFRRMGALESMFDPEQTVVSLLDAVKVNVANTIKTVDAAATLENKLSEEAARFNHCLTTMSNAIRKCERGEISREEMLEECRPCVTALKEKCVALTLADVKANGDDITEEEIAMLREYVVGCKDIVADRKRELQDCSCASEGLLAGLADYEPATEATSIAKQIRYSTEAKTAHQLYKQAKKMYGLGSKEKALDYLKSAKKHYESCLAKAEKEAKMFTVKRSVEKTGGKYDDYSKASDTFSKKVTANTSLANVIQYFEDRIDSCTALELQWSNKAGKSTFKETKAQLKAERKQAKADRKEARKAERAAKRKGGSSEMAEEAYEILGMSAEEYIEAMEAVMDGIEFDISVDAAMEGEGEEGGVSKIGGVLSRIRGSLSKLRKSDTSSERREASQEVKEAAEELENADKEAKTPEEKSRVKKVAKGAMIALATALIAAGLYKEGKKCKQDAEDYQNKPGLVKTLLIKYANLIDKADNKRVAMQINNKKKSGFRATDKVKQKMYDQVAKADRKAHKKSDSENHSAFMRLRKELESNKEPAPESYIGDEDFLSALAFGMEGVLVDDEDVDDDYIEPMEGRAFDDEDLIEEANEATVAVMLLEDGIDDSDLM